MFGFSSKKNSTSSRQLTLIAATVALIIAGFGYYTFIYVPGREKDLHANNFRVLSKISDNINEEISFYRQSLKTQIGYQLLRNEFNKHYARDNGNDDPKGKDGKSSSPEHIRTQIHEYFPEADLLYIGKMEPHISDSIAKAAAVSDDLTRFTILEDTCWYRSFFEDRLTEYKYAFSLSTERIREKISSDIFDGFLLIKDTVVLAGPRSGVEVAISDSMLNIFKGMRTSNVITQTISGVSYRIFVQPFHLDNGDSFLLCGLVESANYKQQTLNISSGAILLTLLAIFLIALSLPLLKFLLISKHERLSIFDVMVAGMSLILGTSVLVLMAVDLYNAFGPERGFKNNQLKSLTSEISTRFVREVNDACRQLDHYDSLLPAVGTDLVTLGKNPMYDNESAYSYNLPENEGPANALQLRPSYYPYMKTVFWTDSAGQQRFKWTVDQHNSTWANVSKRNYFSRVMSHHTWSLPGLSARNFYVDYLSSWSTGENIAVISKKSNQAVPQWDGGHFTSDTVHTTVGAILTPLHSVVNTILPLGYGFCIIDESGRIIFNSLKDKNQDNFLSECSNSDAVRSTIYSRSENWFETQYQNKRLNLYVAPLDHLPLYVVAFEDTAYNKTNNAEVLSISTMLTLGYFAFVSLQIILLRLISSRRSMLRIRRFHFEWLWPLKENQKAYSMNSFFLLLLLFGLVLMLMDAGPFTTMILFMSSSLFMFCFSYFSIDTVGHERSRLWKRLVSGRKNVLILIAAFSLFILVDVAAFYNSDAIISILIFQASYLIIALRMLYSRLTLPMLRDYRRSYLIFHLLLLSLTSIVPPITFFGIARDHGTESYVRHGQLEFARTLNSESNRLNRDFRLSTTDPASVNGPDVYSDSFFSTKITNASVSPLVVSAETYEDSVFGSVISSLTPQFDDVNANERGLFRHSLDGSRIWRRTADHHLLFLYKDPENRPHSKAAALRITSALPVYRLPLFYSNHAFSFAGFFFWLLVILSIVILYFLIRFIMRRVFTLEFFPGHTFHRHDSDLLRNFMGNSNIFLVGAPFAGKTTWLQNEKELTGKKVLIDLIDLRKDDDVTEKVKLAAGGDIIVLDHFEYGATEADTMRRRLGFFEKLLQLEKKRLLIISTIHPVVFTEEYLRVQKSILRKEDNAAEIGKVTEECARWINLLGGFYKVYFPIQGIAGAKVDGKTIELTHTQQDDIIAQECRNSYFLVKMESMIRKCIADEKALAGSISDEEIILKIQSIGHVYYNALWTSLSREEQYVLYDLAQDGLINLKNRETIMMLLNKGLLLYENRFRIINESFRNFILTEVSADEVLSLEKNIGTKGTWSKLRTPLVLLLVTVALFIFLTQQETFNSIIAFITAFAASIPVIFKLLSMFSVMSPGKKPE